MAKPRLVQSTLIKLHLSRIVFDGTIYPRTLDDRGAPVDFEQRVALYAKNMEAGATFPPVAVVKRGEDYVLIDGWHRVQAYSKRNEFEVPCELLELPEREYLAEAIRRNVGHGYKLTSRDYESVIPKLREQQFLDQEIGDLLALSVSDIEGIRLQEWAASTGMEDQSVQEKPRGKSKVEFEADGTDWSRLARATVAKSEDLKSVMTDWVKQPFTRMHLIKIMDVLGNLTMLVRHKYKITEADDQAAKR